DPLELAVSQRRGPARQIPRSEKEGAPCQRDQVEGHARDPLIGPPPDGQVGMNACQRGARQHASSGRHPGRKGEGGEGGGEGTNAYHPSHANVPHPASLGKPRSGRGEDQRGSIVERKKEDPLDDLKPGSSLSAPLSAAEGFEKISPRSADPPRTAG